MSARALYHRLPDRVKALIPGPVRVLGFRYPKALASDVLRVAARKVRPPLVPPARLNTSGPGEFERVGDGWVRTMRDHARLLPSHRVLDVGCGPGRIARALTSYLEPSAGGSYDGFDLDAAAVRWCQRAYAGLPHFRFAHADVYSEIYNPGGRVPAREFTFPHPAGSFDFVIATSLFTHLEPDAAARYVAECGRVLAGGGVLFSTWYTGLAGDEQDVGSERRFAVQASESHRVEAADRREGAVWYAGEWIAVSLARSGLDVEIVAPGKWRGVHRKDSRHNQDLVVACKAASGNPLDPV